MVLKRTWYWEFSLSLQKGRVCVDELLRLLPSQYSSAADSNPISRSPILPPFRSLLQFPLLFSKPERIKRRIASCSATSRDCQRNTLTSTSRTLTPPGMMASVYLILRRVVRCCGSSTALHLQSRISCGTRPRLFQPYTVDRGAETLASRGRA